MSVPPAWVPLTPEQIAALLEQPEPTDWPGRRRQTLQRARQQLQRFLDEHRDREARRRDIQRLQRWGVTIGTFGLSASAPTSAPPWLETVDPDTGRRVG